MNNGQRNIRKTTKRPVRTRPRSEAVRVMFLMVVFDGIVRGLDTAECSFE
jgi:hypothetical protein